MKKELGIGLITSVFFLLKQAIIPLRGTNLVVA